MLRWCFLCVCLGLAVAADPVGLCGLAGYDLNPLYNSALWSFTIDRPKENCFHEIPDDDVMSCTVFFSICKPLPKDLCGGNVSVCQVVIGSSGTVHYYDIGNYSTRHAFAALSDGFLAIRTGKEYPEEKLCKTSALTSIFRFDCDLNAKYNSDEPDITRYVSSAIRIPSSPCYNVYTLKYSGACYIPPTLAPSDCNLEGFDTGTISKREYWTADVPTGACIGITDTCKFVFAFCHPLPLHLSEHCRNPESAVCQTDKLVQSTKSWSMGAFENYTRFYENVDTTQAGFHVQYSHGSNPGDPKCINGLSTRVIFVCNKDAEWKTEDVTFYTEIEREGCYYNIVMQYSGACRKMETVTTANTPSSTSTGTTTTTPTGEYVDAPLAV